MLYSKLRRCFPHLIILLIILFNIGCIQDDGEVSKFIKLIRSNDNVRNLEALDLLRNTNINHFIEHSEIYLEELEKKISTVPPKKVQLEIIKSLSNAAFAVDEERLKLESQVGSRDSKVKAWAEEELIKIGNITDSIKTIMILAAKSNYPEVRNAALGAARAFKFKSPDDIEFLKVLLLDNELRASALEILVFSDALSGEKSILLELALDEDPRVAMFAIMGLKSLIADDEIINALLEALEHEDPQVRQEAVYALGHYEEESAAAIPKLLELIYDDELFGFTGQEKVRYAALHTLEWHVSSHWDVQRALLNIIENDDDERAVWWAILSVGKGRPSGDTIKILLDKLDHDSAEVRKRAARILGDFGSASEAAILKLSEILETDENNLVKEEARIAINKIEYNLKGNPSDRFFN